MHCASSIERVLQRISDENDDVLGSALVTPNQYYKHLTWEVSRIDVESVHNYASNMFAISGAIDQSSTPLNQLFLEFGHVSLFAMKFDTTILILMLRPMERAAFAEIQSGLLGYLTPLQEALFAVEGQGSAILVRPVAQLRPDAEPSV